MRACVGVEEDGITMEESILQYKAHYRSFGRGIRNIRVEI